MSGSGGALPARGEFVVRGGHVLTMDASLGDLPSGDVHVRDGAKGRGFGTTSGLT
jgi:hypothetical protein